MMEEPRLSTAQETANGESFRNNRIISWEEIKKILLLALPMVFGVLLQSSLQLVSIIIVGHINKLSFASVSVATSFANITGFSVLAGLAGGLDTLCGQAFGAKQYRLHGVLVQRAVFVLFCVSITLSVMLLYTENILVTFGQDPSISFEAGEYAKWLIPSLFAHVFILPLEKFLQTQSIVMPVMLTSAFSLIVHAPLCWFLVFKTGLKIKGAALSMGISHWSNVALLSLYIKFSDACKKTRAPITKEAFHGIKEILKVFIPTAIMTCLEWWSYEILFFLSGLLPNPELEASIFSICLNTISFAFMIGFGVGSAASTRISNELGAGNSQDAILAARSTMCLSFTEVLMRGITLLSLKNVWGCLFSNDSDVIHHMKNMMPILAISTMLEGFQAALSGIARGCGLQGWGVFANLIAYYAIGIPLATIMAFILHLGTKGLWIGILVGDLTQTIVLCLVNVMHDWNKLAMEARERACGFALPTAD